MTEALGRTCEKHPNYQLQQTTTVKMQIGTHPICYVVQIYYKFPVEKLLCTSAQSQLYNLKLTRFYAHRLNQKF